MYSAGMKKLAADGWVWTEENIDKWIADPKAMIPDSPMALAFPGVPDAGERADIIAYLKTSRAVTARLEAYLHSRTWRGRIRGRRALP